MCVPLNLNVPFDNDIPFTTARARAKAKKKSLKMIKHANGHNSWAHNREEFTLTSCPIFTSLSLCVSQQRRSAAIKYSEAAYLCQQKYKNTLLLMITALLAQLEVELFSEWAFFFAKRYRIVRLFMGD
jgi:hypothetical protein